ncbi:MAG TPA: CAP domain-containing protein [Jatrophihabitans sp.]
MTTRRILSIILALVVMAGAGLVEPQLAGAATHPTTTTEKRIAKSVLTLLNKERKAHHLEPLAMSGKLVTSAHRHNVAMAKADELSHQLPGEAGFATRITRAGFRYSYAGENIGVTTRTNSAGARQLEVLMYNEKPPNDGHRKNILSKHFTRVGINIFIDKHGNLWLTEDFGRPR